MFKPLLLSCLALVFCAGCNFLRRSKSKEDASITAEVQETFRKRWVDRRASELVAQGTAAEAARAQAEREFIATYNLPAPAVK